MEKFLSVCKICGKGTFSHTDTCTLYILQAKDWIKSYTNLRTVHASYRPEYVTPYMHILTYHVPHLIRRYGNIKQFSCQGKIVF